MNNNCKYWGQNAWTFLDYFIVSLTGLKLNVTFKWEKASLDLDLDFKRREHCLEDNGINLFICVSSNDKKNTSLIGMHKFCRPDVRILLPWDLSLERVEHQIVFCNRNAFYASLNRSKQSAKTLHLKAWIIWYA